jgi:hypothetical protein
VISKISKQCGNLKYARYITWKAAMLAGTAFSNSAVLPKANSLAQIGYSLRS